MACNTNVFNTEKGSFCFKGAIDGFALAENALTVSIASLQSKSWWEAQVYASSDRVTSLVGSDNSEIVAGEITEYKPKRGFGTQTNKSSNEYILKFKDTECLRSTLDELNGAEVYALFFTASNKLQGIRNGANNMDFVKANLSVSSEVDEDVRLLVVKFTFALDFESMYSEVALETGFTTDEIPGITGLKLFGVSCSTTDLIVDIRDCSYTAVDGLATTKITAYDVTAGAEVTTTSVTDNGDGTYTLVGTYTSGHVVGARYTGPETGNLYIQTSKEDVTVA